MLEFSAPVPPETLKKFAPDRISALSYFRVFDEISEFIDFAKSQRSKQSEDTTPDMKMSAGTTLDGALASFTNGDLKLVAASDKYLAEMEARAIEAPRRAWVSDVSGAAANVQAFIAGHPLAMRRRSRSLDAYAPLTVIVDVGASAWTTVETIQRRGAAILALVRALAPLRPVELFACAGLDADHAQNASWNFVRVETAPLDLARAAFILTHPAAIRHVFWTAALANGFIGKSPYRGNQSHREHTAEIIAPAFAHAQETLVINRAEQKDLCATNPAAWLKQQIEKYTPTA